MKKSSRNLVKVCPICGSRKIVEPIGSSAITPYYVCNNCGYRSTLFPEVDRKEAGILEKDSTARKEKFEKFLKHKKVKEPSTLLYFFSLILLVLIFASWVSLAAGKPINPIGSFMDIFGPEFSVVILFVIIIVFIYYLVKPKH